MKSLAAGKYVNTAEMITKVYDDPFYKQLE